jgi:hypothetical protein
MTIAFFFMYLIMYIFVHPATIMCIPLQRQALIESKDTHPPGGGKSASVRPGRMDSNLQHFDKLDLPSVLDH